MKTSKLIERLQALLKKEGDLEVGISTPNTGSYAWVIKTAKAGPNGRCDVEGFGDTGIEPGERVIVIFGKDY